MTSPRLPLVSPPRGIAEWFDRSPRLFAELLEIRQTLKRVLEICRDPKPEEGGRGASKTPPV
jgi:hypothetical protein